VSADWLVVQKRPQIAGQIRKLEVKEGDKTYFNPQVFFPVGGNTYDGTSFVTSGVPPDPAKPFSYSLTFTKPGRYAYVCTIHGPGMGGTISVGERARSPAVAAAAPELGSIAFASPKSRTLTFPSMEALMFCGFRSR